MAEIKELLLIDWVLYETVNMQGRASCSNCDLPNNLKDKCQIETPFCKEWYNILKKSPLQLVDSTNTILVLPKLEHDLTKWAFSDERDMRISVCGKPCHLIKDDSNLHLVDLREELIKYDLYNGKEVLPLLADIDIEKYKAAITEHVDEYLTNK